MARDESEIGVGPGGMTFAGPDAVRLFQAMSLRSGLRLWVATGLRPNYAYTPRAMLAAVGRITHQKYRISKPAAKIAIADLDVWIAAMQAALPVKLEGE